MLVEKSKPRHKSMSKVVFVAKIFEVQAAGQTWSMTLWCVDIFSCHYVFLLCWLVSVSCSILGHTISESFLLYRIVGFIMTCLPMYIMYSDDLSPYHFLPDGFFLSSIVSLNLPCLSTPSSEHERKHTMSKTTHIWIWVSPSQSIFLQISWFHPV